MKKLLLSVLLLASGILLGQEGTMDYRALNQKYIEKVNTLDQTINSLYEVISGEKGTERNEELLRYLFHPEAKLAATGKRKNGAYGTRYVSLDEYADKSLKWMVENGFYENEMHRVVERFGPIAHVFSSYETFYSQTDEEPFMRGINSIQLMHTGNRWVIVSLFFTQESEENPIPQKYLPKK